MQPTEHPVAYTAGRYRAATEDGLYQNIQLARRCAVDCWAAGFVPLAPQLNSAFMGGVVSDATFLAGTLALMRKCDCVVMLPNWRESQGAIAERQEAVRLGIPVYEWETEGDGWRILARYRAEHP